MSQPTTSRRPWLAALLGALATGLGHLYLRRWRRGLGWLVALFGVSAFLVDPAVLDALANWNAVDPLEVAPVVIIGIFSTVDAYILAHAQNAVARMTATEDGRLTHCPRCGRELDAELEFCHWCTAEVEELEVVRSAKLEDGDER